MLALTISSLEREAAKVRSELDRVRAANAELRAELREKDSVLARRRGEARRLRSATRAMQSCTSPRSGYGPHVWLIPDHGPPGTKVTIVGDCFKGGTWDARGGYGIFLVRQFSSPRSCEIIAAGAPFAFEIDGYGRGSGFFTVPARGACFQEEYGRRVTPAVYDVGLACHACAVASFRVTAGPRAR